MHCADHMSPEEMLQAKLSALRGEAGDEVGFPLETLGILTNRTSACVRTKSRTQKTQLQFKQTQILSKACGVTIRVSDLKILYPLIAQDIFAMQEILRLDWKKAKIPQYQCREICKVLAPYLRHYAKNLPEIRSVFVARPTGLNL
jgi:recombinational DNA repair protein (RecF pathway)